MQKLNVKCPICGSNQFISISGKMICKVCGAVITDEESLIYVPKSKVYVKRLVSSSKYKRGLKILQEISEKLELPRYIIDQTNELLKLLVRKYRKRINPYVAIATLLIYVARRNEYPLTYREIEKVFLYRYGLNIERNKVIRMIEALKKFDIIEDYTNPDYIVITNIFLLRLINEFNIYPRDNTYYEKMWNIITNLTHELKKFFNGKNPRTVAAILIYLAEMWLSRFENRKNYFTQKKLASVVGISRFTLRERIKELYDYKGEKLRDILDNIKRAN